METPLDIDEFTDAMASPLKTGIEGDYPVCYSAQLVGRVAAIFISLVI